MRFLIVTLLVLGLLASPVFAEANDTNETANLTEDISVMAATSDMTIDESEAGALPGDFTYGFQRFFENVDKFFTFDKAEKAKKNAKYGKLRSIEAHLMTKKAQQQMAQGDGAGANYTLQLAQQLLDDYASESQEAQDNIEAALEEGTADENDVQEVQGTLRNSIVVLQRVYEKAPESAKPGLARALNNSINNQARHEEKMQEQLEKKLGKQIAKQSGASVSTDGDDTESDDGDEGDTVAGGNGNDKPKGKPDNVGNGNGKGKDKTGSDADEDEEEQEEEEDETEENETEST